MTNYHSAAVKAVARRVTRHCGNMAVVEAEDANSVAYRFILDAHEAEEGLGAGREVDAYVRGLTNAGLEDLATEATTEAYVKFHLG